MHVTDCKICGTDGAPYERLSGDTYSVNCPVCKLYAITGTASRILSSYDKWRRDYLAGKVRRHWADTKRPMKVSSESLDETTGPQLVGVLEKQDALMLDIAALSKHPGDMVKLQPNDYIVVDGASTDELTYHIQSLIDRKFLQLRGTLYEAVLTSEGWGHVERLRSPTTGNRSDIFVAMSFSAALQGAWESGIKPGIAAAGYNPKRVDSVAHNDKIDDRIIAGIRACYAVVVDVTTQNAGAYFEAGFAMGLGRPVVWTVREDDLKNLHFDTRQFRHIVWSEPGDLADKLTNHLLAVFGRGPG